MPQIALEPPVAAPLSNLDRRLYRRVIELYDGSLALRPYLDEAAANRAGRIGTRLGMRADDLAAVMEAARLRGAVRAYGHGAPQPAVEEDAMPARLDEGTDLAEEVARLVRVSRAYAGSPVVAAAVAGRDALPAEETEVAM
nr:DUF6545 domain-containing protein [Phytohabitans flavus]